MRRLIIGAALVSLAGCQSEASRRAAAERILVTEGQAAVADLLIDPTSPLFTEVKATRATDAVCGYVNGKNRLGAYVGKKRFVWVRGGQAIIEADTLGVEATPLATLNACLFDAQFRQCAEGGTAPAVSQCIRPEGNKEGVEDRPRTRPEARDACVQALTSRFARRSGSGPFNTVNISERYDYEKPAWRVQVGWRSDTVAGVGECRVPSSGVVEVVTLGLE